MSVSQSASDFRSYFAQTVESAMAMAREELGDDAILLGSRKTNPAETPSGQYEVRFAAPAAQPAEPARDVLPRQIVEQVAEMRRQLATMHRALSKSVLNPPRWLSPSSALAGLLTALVYADVDGEIAHEIADSIHARSAGGFSEEGHGWLDAARAELMRRLKIAATIGTAEMGRRVVALVGPPGAGKTTTAVKLAVRFGLSARRSVHLISTDDYRIGGADQLRSFATILGVGFQVVPTAAALAQALDEHRSKDLILIDTPGLALRELPECADLARFLTRRPDIDTQLVLMSSMRSADLQRMWEAFRMFQPGKLIFTRADETDVLGGVYSLAVRSGKPVSFLTTGQRIPEDLEPATPEAITGRLLTCNELHTEAAA